MSYTAKTNWKNGDKLPASDLNRIEQGVLDAHTIAESKVDATQVQQAIENATASKIDASQAQDLIDNSIADLAKQTYVDTQIDTKLSEYAQEAGTELDSVKNDIADNTQRIEALEDAPKPDEKVKMTADGTADYLQAMLDGVTIINNNGKLTVENLNGLLVTKEDLNQLAGVKANIQGQIDSLSSVGSFKGAVNNLNELYNISPAPNVGDYYIVLEDSDHGDVSTIYMFSEDGFQFLGEFTVEIRDFTTEPLNLETEATGVLPVEHIPTGTTVNTVATGDHTHAEATTTAAGFISTADKTKLNAIAAGATKNDTDAQLRDRSTHTGSQSFATLNDVAAVEQIPNLDAAKIATGTLSAERLPIGTTEGTVASGAHTHSNATTEKAGFMTPADKAKLDSLLSVKPVDAPVINITDPVDPDNIMEMLNSIVASLVEYGVYNQLAFTPAQLFANGEVGTLLDFRTKRNFYQDRDLKTPAEYRGIVRGIRDKSGTAHHATVTNNSEAPILGRKPITGVRNLLTQSANPTASIWVVNGATKEQGYLDSNGLNNAVKITGPTTGPTYIRHTDALPQSGIYTATVIVKPLTTKISLLVRNATTATNFKGLSLFPDGTHTEDVEGVGNWVVTPLDNGFYKCVYTTPEVTQADTIWIYFGYTNAQADANSPFIVESAQLELGNKSTNFQKTGSTLLDVTEDGVTSVDYLNFDTNDVMRVDYPETLTIATVFYVDQNNTYTILENQTVDQVQLITQYYKYFGTINRALTAIEKANLKKYINETVV